MASDGAEVQLHDVGARDADWGEVADDDVALTSMPTAGDDGSRRSLRGRVVACMPKDRKQLAVCGGVLAAVLILTGVIIAVTSGGDGGGTGVIKPANDHRQYQYQVMPNGLRALFISDPTTEQASCAMDVHVGSWANPRETLGLAHFLEHMLFMGSEKYPDENAYSSYLAEHGGGSNAFTASEDTNYFFSVNADALEGAMDRFAQFFIAPLFNSSSTTREMHAVASEHEKNLLDDGWRQYSLLKRSADPDSPFYWFGTGDLSTLDKPDIHEQLLDFHHRYYSANRMTLVVYGKESIAELAAMAGRIFSEVPNRNVDPPPAVPDPFPQSLLGKFTLVKPVEDSDSLALYWPLPPQWSSYRQNPGGYLSHLLGHESAGSLLSYLKSRGLAESVSAGLEVDAAGFSVLYVVIGLEPGLGSDAVATQDVIEAVYAYVHMLRANDDQGIVQWIWQESKDLAEIGFRYAQPGRVSSTTSGLAMRLQQVEPEYVLSPPSSRMWDADLIRAALARVTPSNQLAFAWGPNVDMAQLTSTDPIYGTQFHTRSLSAVELELYNGAAVSGSAMHLPERNPFIPTDFTLVTSTQYDGFDKPGTGRVPVELPSPDTDTSGGPAATNARVWYLQDTMFKLPMVSATFEITAPLALGSAADEVLAQFYLMAVQDALQEISYQASLAGRSYNVQPLSVTSGFQLDISGYSHRFPEWAAAVVEAVGNPPIDETRFNEYKASLVQEYDNLKVAVKPYQRAVYWESVLGHESKWLLSELSDAVPLATVDMVRGFVEEVMQTVSVEAFVHGNIAEADARAVVRDTIEKLSSGNTATGADGPAFLVAADQARRQVSQLPTSQHVYQARGSNPDEPNSAVMVTWQAGLRDHCGGHTSPGRRTLRRAAEAPASECLARASMIDLLATMLYNPAFDQLRTQEQLGYIVFAFGTGRGTSFGPGAGTGAGERRGEVTSDQLKNLNIIVQGEFGANYLDERVEAFVFEYQNSLAALDADVFAESKASQQAQLRQHPNSMSDLTSAVWAEIGLHTYLFNRGELEAAALEDVTQAQVATFFRQVIGAEEVSGQSVSRRLAVEIFGKDHSVIAPSGRASATSIGDPGTFVAGNPYWSG